MSPGGGSGGVGPDCANAGSVRTKATKGSRSILFDINFAPLVIGRRRTHGVTRAPRNEHEGLRVGASGACRCYAVPPQSLIIILECLYGFGPRVSSDLARREVARQILYEACLYGVADLIRALFLRQASLYETE